MLGSFSLQFVHFLVDVLLSVSDLGLHTFCSLLAFDYGLVILSQLLQLLHVSLNFGLLCSHFDHFLVELFDCILHLLAFLEENVLPLDKLLSFPIISLV